MIKKIKHILVLVVSFLVFGCENKETEITANQSLREIRKYNMDKNKKLLRESQQNFIKSKMYYVLIRKDTVLRKESRKEKCIRYIYQNASTNAFDTVYTESIHESHPKRIGEWSFYQFQYDAGFFASPRKDSNICDDKMLQQGYWAMSAKDDTTAPFKTMRRLWYLDGVLLKEQEFDSLGNVTDEIVH